ncbi:MAG: DHH family phosphoesterase [bacterium]|nr:DHH family phosphoesterase [bacterium]
MLTPEEQIYKQIEKAENILIAFNADWNGDAIASSLALFNFLKKSGKKVEVAAWLESDENNKDKAVSVWSFLPGFDNIQTSLKNLRKFIVSLDISQAVINQIKYSVDGQHLNFIISPEKGWFKPEDISTSSSGFKHDLIFVIDTPDLESLGQIYDSNVEFFYKTTIINIDHQASNEEFGQINYLDLNVVSSAEIIYNLLKQDKNGGLDEDVATCLLAGIISKTKNFKAANLTPRTLLTSSKLIGYGARREEMISQLYRSRPLSALKLWGKLLNNLQSDKEKRLLWSLLTPEETESFDTANIDLSDIVDEILTGVPEAKLVLIAFASPHDGSYRVSAFAAKGVSAVEALKVWQGVGNHKIATALIDISSDHWNDEVIAPIKAKLDKNFG